MFIIPVQSIKKKITYPFLKSDHGIIIYDSAVTRYIRYGHNP